MDIKIGDRVVFTNDERLSMIGVVVATEGAFLRILPDTSGYTRLVARRDCTRMKPAEEAKS